MSTIPSLRSSSLLASRAQMAHWASRAKEAAVYREEQRRKPTGVRHTEKRCKVEWWCGGVVVEEQEQQEKLKLAVDREEAKDTRKQRAPSIGDGATSTRRPSGATKHSPACVCNRVLDFDSTRFDRHFPDRLWAIRCELTLLQGAQHGACEIVTTCVFHLKAHGGAREQNIVGAVRHGTCDVLCAVAFTSEK